jgi:GMP reductase
LDEWKHFAESNPECLHYVAASSGTGQGDFERLTVILEEIPGVTYICLDVANGYSQHFVEYVRKVRAAFPNHTIIVSQSCTSCL